MSDRFLLLEDSSPDRKFLWAIAIIGSEVIVCYGAAGTKPIRKPLRQDSERSPAEVAMAAVDGQLRKGFSCVGICSFDQNGHVETFEASASKVVPVNAEQRPAVRGKFKEAVLFYEIVAPDWHTLTASFTTLLGHLDGLVAYGWVNRQGLPTGVPMVGRFHVAFPDWPGVGRVRQTGLVFREDGMGAIAYLFGLRAIGADLGVTVNLTTSDNRNPLPDLRRELKLLAELGVSFEHIKDIAEALGLVERLFAVSQAEMRQANLWF